LSERHPRRLPGISLAFMQAATEMLKEQNDETLNALLEIIFLRASLISLLSASVDSSIL